jgi:hypothetical protein
MLIPFNGQNVFSIYSSTIEEEIINATGSYFEVLKRLELQPPFAISLNLLNIKDYVLKIEVVTPWRIFKYDRYLLQCPVVLLNNYNEIISKILRPIFDSLWNAFGYERSLHYDSNRNWHKS